jgi:hypothetical protein
MNVFEDSCALRLHGANAQAPPEAPQSDVDWTCKHSANNPDRDEPKSTGRVREQTYL